MEDEIVKFIEFPKIARFARQAVISEKIDGTNGVVFIGKNGEFFIGSRSRWITPADDNYGFAAWAYEHKEELIIGLGAGRHYGEWWGKGIQRAYGLAEKRFSLINCIRWAEIGAELQLIPQADPRIIKSQQYAPVCCHVVPKLWCGQFDKMNIDTIISELQHSGSIASPGFMRPEGVIIFHIAGNVAFKKTIEKDDIPKGRV
mgnify:CR=1 FL=1